MQQNLKHRILITEYQDRILSALWDGQRVLEFQAEKRSSQQIQVGDIYIGRVSNYVKNIQAVFVEIAPGVNCFYQLKQAEKIAIGTEFPVQITREPVKTKLAVCSRDISLAGRYMVLTGDSKAINVSAKLPYPVRMELKEALKDLPKKLEVGFIVRTNAAECDLQVLLEEAERLAEKYHSLLATAAHRPVYTRLQMGMPAYLTLLQGVPMGSVEEIVTDLPEVHREIENYMQSLIPEDRIPLRLYQDASYSMTKLYRLEHALENALGRYVWLPSGGYLVIDPTEALTVIDVNTGKTDSHKKPEETFFRTDKEAALEISRQMRLRNLSGIILVDFIDLKSEEKKQELFDYLRECLRQDPVRSILVDITALHLAEITRKKIRGTLKEQLAGTERKKD